MSETVNKFEEMIPWYVNGTLNASDREAMERYLATNEAARNEVALFERTQSAMREAALRVPEDIGLEKSLARIRTERTSAASITTTYDARSSWQRFREWFAVAWAKPALVVALAVIGVQSALLMRTAPAMRGDAPQSTMRAEPNASLLRVTFSPTASEAEVRILLTSTGARMYDGPTEDGSYLVQVADRDAIRALEAFRSSRAVANANGAAR